MSNQVSFLDGETDANDSRVAPGRLLEQPPENSWVILALGVFCLLVGTVVVTDTGERFSLDL